MIDRSSCGASAFSDRTGLRDSLLIALLVSLLIAPLFRLRYLDNWASIESTFIASARMLNERLSSGLSGWQPLWYCGTRTDYIYPPALPWGTVLISRIGHVLPARAYHIYIAVFYVFGILAVYWLARVGSGSRAAAWLAAAATALLSPSFLLLGVVRHDSPFRTPQRLHVLMAYGEGPHISALCILPAALAAAFLALRSRGCVALVAGSALCALVVANNFYGATALAIFYPILVWSVWLGERGGAVWLRAAAIPLLAWGLNAFWLTPSYVRITLTDLKWVAQPANLPSRIVLLVAVAIYGAMSLRLSRRKREREWPAFVFGSALVFGIYVIGNYDFGLNIWGDARRFVPELDLALTLALVECARTLWRKPRFRVPVAVAIALAFLPSLRYLRHAWASFPKAAPLETVYQYQTAGWIARHLPHARTMASGSVRLWLDDWSDTAQLQGGSDQGMLNQILPVANYQILHEPRADLAVLWLKALGTDAIEVPGRGSPDPYLDFAHPDKFRGALPVLYDDGHGTVIYGVQRLHAGIARVVETSALATAGKVRGGDDAEVLARYVAAVENPAVSAATLTWHGFDNATVEGSTTGGQAILVQETWDPAWRAYENGKPLPIHADLTMGFMLIDTQPGRHTIEMRFETPLENRVGEVLFLITAAVMAGLVIRR